jgi:hypothetical protein
VFIRLELAFVLQHGRRAVAEKVVEFGERVRDEFVVVDACDAEAEHRLQNASREVRAEEIVVR